MDEQIRASIAKITVGNVNESVRGTAFLVAKDLVATALHNVAEHDAAVPLQGQTPKWLGPITLDFPHHRATSVTPVKWDYDADCILLKCDDPSNAAPLTLQSLQRSGSEWETYGFPNLQWLDGLVLNGHVTNHAGELYGAPAIQLLSKQLEAGIGPDASGLSGSPVLVHNAVVGLVRFALGAEGRTEGGTIYACPARYLIALEPTLALQPMRNVQPLLPEQQAKELVNLYTSRFVKQRETLETVCRLALGRELDDITQTGSDRPIERIVSDLLNWANQQGPGPLEALLYLTSRARPQDAELRTFCGTYAPQALQPPDMGALIFHITRALNVLTAMTRASEKVRRLRKVYQDDFQITLQQLFLVDKYKALHNILHDLQFRLEAIELSLSSPASDAKDNIALQRYAREIDDLAEDAEQYPKGLKTEALERTWINGLTTLSEDMRSVAQPEASELDRGQVSISLRSLVNQATVSVNNGLAQAAGDLRLASLIDMVDAVIAQANPGLNELDQLSQGAAAAGALEVTIAGVVAEHAAWQVVSTKLEAAKSTLHHQPQKKIRDWPVFEKRLRELCGIYPEQPWSRRLTRRLDEWVDATQSETPTPEEKLDAREALLSFAGSCNDRFFKVDALVKTISEKIVQLTPTLSNFLRA